MMVLPLKHEAGHARPGVGISMQGDGQKASNLRRLGIPGFFSLG